MKYVLRDNAVAVTYLDIDGLVKRIDAGTLFFSMQFEEDEFCGYEQCECCETVSAMFTVDKHTDEQGQNVHYYMKVNAEYVDECA